MARRKKGLPVHGWVFLDKPPGMGSTDAVSLVRHTFNAQKAGHAGTLDPLATGLLGVALGEATKTVPWMMDATKVYEFTVRWGVTTSTGDADARAEIIATSDVRPEPEAIRAALGEFIGDIEQVPPAYSAIKVDGRRAHDLARAGEAVHIEARTVHIDQLRLTGCPDRNHASFEVVCGKGTYVRSLGLDLAHKLGTEGHLTALRRTATGGIRIAQAVTVEALQDAASAGALEEVLHPLDAVLSHLPRLDLDEDLAARAMHGNPVAATLPFAPEDAAPVLLTHHGQPLAIALADDGMVRPFRVFNLDEG